MRIATKVAINANCRLNSRRILISSLIGRPVHIEVPKSSRTMPQVQTANCCPSGLSKPNCDAFPLDRLLGCKCAAAGVLELDDIPRRYPQHEENQDRDTEQRRDHQ